MSSASAVSPAQPSPGIADHFPTTSVIECDRESIIFPCNQNDQVRPTAIRCSKTSSAIALAASLIRNDRVVAFPTETVYGLGASATSSTAVSKIFLAKGRPSDNPLIVHVSSKEMLKSFLPPDWVFPKIYHVLSERFWPGPLTILVPTTSPAQQVSKISDLVTCGLATVAVRMPAHHIARALISESGRPIAAPSANRSGRPSPTTAQHVAGDLDHRIQLILDGGCCDVGVESTVVDGLHPDGRLRVLRLGGLSVEDIETCLVQAGVTQLDGKSVLAGVHNKDYKDSALEAKPSTPGMKYKHYAPNARVIIMDPTETVNPENCVDDSVPDVARLVSELSTPSLQLSKRVHIGLMLVENSALAKEFRAHSQSLNPLISLHYSDLGPVDRPDISAQRLFLSLRLLDEDCNADFILVERLCENGLGATVMERLGKASNHSPIRPVRIS